MQDRQWDLLKDLSSRESSQVLALGTSRTFRGGDTIFDLAEEARTLYLVADGIVDLELPMRLGETREFLAVEERVPGQMLGWSALVPPHRFTLRATARTESELLALPREDLQSFLSSRPDLGCLVMTNLATIVGERFQVFQAMWVREIQRAVEGGNA